MPRIQGYQQQYAASGDIPARQAQERDFGGPGLIEAGRGVQSAGQDLGYAQRQLQLAESQRQVTDVHTALQQIRSDYTKKVLEAEAKADPSDTGFGDRFMMGQSGEGDEGSFKWALDTYREQISDPQARAAFDREASSLTTHFTVHLAQSQARMAGVHAKQQAITMVNAAQDTVQTDPSQYESVLQQTISAIDDPNGIFYRPGLDAGVRETIKRGTIEQLSSSAVRGMIRDSPQHAKHSLMSGEWDQAISGEQKVALLTAADHGIHAREVQAAQAETQLVKQQKRLANASQLTFVQQLAAHDADPLKHKMPDPVAVSQSPFAQIDPDGAQAFINVLHTRAKEGLDTPQRSNPVVMRKLFNRIHLPYGDPRKIVDPMPVHQDYINGNLSWDDMKHLEKEVFESLTPEGGKFGQDKKRFFDAIEKKIVQYDAFQVLTDPTAPERFLWFQQDVEQRIAQYKKEGNSPRMLFDRNSKDYMGTDTALASYRRDPLDVMRERSGVPSLRQEAAPPASGKKRSLDEIHKGARQ
jgi:hypothetical protein